jgi:hypothetical protein
MICLLATMWAFGVIIYMHRSTPRWILQTVGDGDNCLNEYTFDPIVTETFSNGR